MKHLKITVDGKVYDVEVEEIDEQNNQIYDKTKNISENMKKNVSDVNVDGEQVKAPMAGTIVSVNVSEGQSLKKGDVIVILEAMKMKNEILAPKDGTIASLQVTENQNVQTNQIIAVLK